MQGQDGLLKVYRAITAVVPVATVQVKQVPDIDVSRGFLEDPHEPITRGLILEVRLTATVSITTPVEDGESWSVWSITTSRRYSAGSSVWRKMFVAGD